MADAFRGDWMQTYTGRQFWPMDPRLEDIHLDDIAHALALQCRFAGHSRTHYSVAQHSMHVYGLVVRAGVTDPVVRLQALLHDAAEAYVVDMPTPIKRFMPEYRDIEDRLLRVIWEKFGIFDPMHEVVKKADVTALITERDVLHRRPPASWNVDGEQDDEMVKEMLFFAQLEHPMLAIESRFKTIVERYERKVREQIG